MQVICGHSLLKVRCTTAFTQFNHLRYLYKRISFSALHLSLGLALCKFNLKPLRIHNLPPLTFSSTAALFAPVLSYLTPPNKGNAPNSFPRSPTNTAKLSPLIIPRTVSFPQAPFRNPASDDASMNNGKKGRRRRSSSLLYHEPPESIEHMSDQSALPNLNADWVNAKGMFLNGPFHKNAQQVINQSIMK